MFTVNTSHAYNHKVGTQVGVNLGRVYGAGGQNLIVLATIGVASDNQDDNYVRLILENGIQLWAKYTDTVRADFVSGKSDGELSGFSVDSY